MDDKVVEIPDDEYVVEQMSTGQIKLCPHCKAYGELDSGCNYIKCPACNGEWCWLCQNPKYNPIADKLACNDKTHNSH